jgi:hypothetical protein
MLSVVKDVPVECSPYNSNFKLNTIVEEVDGGALPENDIDDDSGEYRCSSGRGANTSPPMTHSRARNSRGNTELLVHTFLGP